MRWPPGATYRVQLHAGFGFAEAARIADYLAALGITHLYCSPYLQAAPGSSHGYDVVDPQRLNIELGGAPAHAAMSGALRAAGLGQVLDIVPNHMAVDPANPWWWDVLENGPASLFAGYFDIDWEGPEDKSAFTVLAPVLEDHYGRVVEAGALWLERTGGSVVLHHQDHVFPISPRTLDEVLAAAARRAGSAALGELGEAFGALPSSRMLDEASVRERHERKVALTAELEKLCAAADDVTRAIDDELVAVRRDPDRLDALLRRQNYRLAHWRTADEELDYRRFFNIETLVGVRIEDPEVFAATHALILELVRDGTVDGLRIDHVDGLRDPKTYLARLADQARGAYTVVEKILEPGESLPPSWAVSGTSGYDFLVRTNNLFVATENESAMSAAYAAFTGETGSFGDVVYAAKHQIMRADLAAEVEHMTALAAKVTEHHRRHRDHTRRDLREALRELVAGFPVYRTYIQPGRPATMQERSHVAAAVAAARDRRPDIDPELLGFLGEVALGAHGGAAEVELGQRLQQLTAPVMAKGVEDTAFYRYHRLGSLNEVGGNPGVFGRSVLDFHRDTAASAATWPHSMLTLSTHDTKRSADVRARLNVLSEVPDRWRVAVERWAERNEPHRRSGALDRNTEYLLYQTLVGAWPIEADRVVAFMAKAVKEAKVHTSWTDPDAEYDEAVSSFARAVIDDRDFVEDLEQFLAERRIVERGRRSSLAQTTLLLTCPGVPDLYQGSELWDLSLVDPDNRRPVDYHLRARLLDSVGGADAARALAGDDVGVSKQWLIRGLLAHRRSEPGAYESDTYEPLELRGARADDAIAFTRAGLAVVVPRHGLGPWAGTSVGLPPGSWSNVLTGESTSGGDRRLDELLGASPVAVLARSAA